MRIIKEARRSFNSTPIYNWLIIVLFAISLSVTLFSLSSAFVSSGEGNTYRQMYGETNYYKITDNLVGNAEKRFFNSEDSVGKLKRFYSMLSSSEKFEYLEIYKQPIEVDNFKGGVDFLYNYESGLYENQPLKRELTLSDGYSGVFSNVKAVWLSENSFSSFNIAVANGRTFTDEEYQYSEDAVLPILLGAKYKNYYKIGDTFHVDEIVTCGEAQVVGFLKDGTSIWTGSHFDNLDDYMILPMINDKSIISDQADYFRQVVLYLMKINGLIVSSHLCANEVQAYVNEMCRECEIIPSSYIDGATNSQSYIFGLNINQIIDALTTISLFLVIFACFILSVFMFTKIKQKLRYYAILSLCNFTMHELYMMITFEVMLFIIISNLLSFALSGIVFMIMQMPFKVQFLAYILVVDIVTALASILPSIHELHNSDMTVLFRRR